MRTREDLKDVALAQRVQTAIGSSQRLGAYPIKVTAVDGTVYLSGRVPREEPRIEAELVASGTTGVRKVVNEIECRPY